MVENGKITAATLGPEGHGIMTGMLFLELEGGGSQGFGGYSFEREGRKGRGGGIEWIRRVLDVVGVEDWSKLVGKYVRAEREGGRLVKIGHIVENRWLSHDDIDWTY